jgi:BASS family bile acid:Na+ symporter
VDLLIKCLTLGGLAALMLGMGLKVRWDEVVGALRGQPRAALLAVLANFVLAPAFTLALLWVFQPHPMASLGFLILAVCPGAPIGPPFTALARGDVASSIAWMVLLAGLSAVLSPALLVLLTGPFMPPEGLKINFLAIVMSLMVAQLIPLAVGLVVHAYAPAVAARLQKPVALLGNVLLLTLFVLLLCREYESLAQVRPQGWLGMVLLLLATLAIGWVCGGPGVEGRKAMALTTGSRNVGVGLAIAGANFAGTLAVSALVVYGLFSILASLGCARLLARLGQPASPEVAPPPASQAS